LLISRAPAFLWRRPYRPQWNVAAKSGQFSHIQASTQTLTKGCIRLGWLYLTLDTEQGHSMLCAATAKLGVQ